MKKTLFATCIMLCISMNTHAVPKWLSEIFGCTWTWSSAARPVAGGGGMCKYERDMSGHSWLWGDCGTETYTYTIPCSDNPDFYPVPPEYQGPSYGTIAHNMDQLAAVGYQVKPEWRDEGRLRGDENILREAVTFRLELAGYEINPEWFNLVENPCPVPQPTTSIRVPQAYTFINGDCSDEVVIYPNPNSGEFSIQINGFENATGFDIVRERDMSVVLTRYAPLNQVEQINITQPAGYYILRVVLVSGVIYKRFIIQ